jgi:hypothetical protein
METMKGGSGSDVFVIDPALEEIPLLDVIADFADGSDVLDLSDLLATVLGPELAPEQGRPATAGQVSDMNPPTHIDIPGGPGALLELPHYEPVASSILYRDDQQPEADIV